jgi:hypothetical protein
MSTVNNLGGLISRITRDQGPEFEQTLNWANTQQISTPTSLRTDRKISFFDLHMRGRITVGAGGTTFRSGPPLLGTPLFALIQQFTVRGQHLRYGSQTPIVMRGETAAEYMSIFYPNWTPTFSLQINGGAITRGASLSGAPNATNDFDFTLPIPTFPINVSSSDVPFYCIHGPDWPGNLYLDILTADATALGSALANIANGSTITAYGGSTGVGTIDILSERPLLSKQLMAQIRPAVTFRIQNFNQPTSAVATGGGGTGTKLADLIVGKDTTRILVKAGAAQAGVSAGVTAYASLSDAIITRTFFQLDNRQLRFQNSNADGTLVDYMGRGVGKTIPVGYRLIDFIVGQESAPSNPKAAFQSSQLTAARKFEIDGDIPTVTSTNLAEVIQEMLLGKPATVASGT